MDWAVLGGAQGARVVLGWAVAARAALGATGVLRWKGEVGGGVETALRQRGLGVSWRDEVRAWGALRTMWAELVHRQRCARDRWRAELPLVRGMASVCSRVRWQMELRVLALQHLVCVAGWVRGRESAERAMSLVELADVCREQGW